jgi:hypothetical protein
MLRIASVYAVSLVYAVVRYIVFVPDNLKNLPAFILNKGISSAAAVCFVMAFWQQWRRGRGKFSGNEPANWFRAGVFGVVAHVPLASTLIRPEYFKEFYDGARLSMVGETIFLCGALTAGCVYLLTRGTFSPVQRWWMSLVTMSVLLNHTLFMGIARGIHIDRKHAYLPPMWMLSVMAIALGIAYLLMSRPAAPEENVVASRPGA